MADQLDNWQLSQLVGQGPCALHFHAPEPVSTSNVVDGHYATQFKAITGTYTATDSDVFLTAAGTFTITLPTLREGKEYSITLLTSTVVTIATTGADTIIGAATYVLNTKWDTVRLKANVASGNWLVI